MNVVVTPPPHATLDPCRHREGVSVNPENTEILTILNNSMLPADISFAFQHDHNGTTFLLHPPTMSLSPAEKKVREPTDPGCSWSGVKCREPALAPDQQRHLYCCAYSNNVTVHSLPSLPLSLPLFVSFLAPPLPRVSSPTPPPLLLASHSVGLPESNQTLRGLSGGQHQEQPRAPHGRCEL